MSLIGIDVGTSAVKVAAYQDSGSLLAVARVPVKPSHPQPGWEETDPDEVWRAVQAGLSELASSDRLRKDPAEALAISASGDEVFLVDEQVNPLVPCILSGDTRGEEIERQTLQWLTPQEWVEQCGHVPERMDPINRLLWWRSESPHVFKQASAYLGWHEFITQKLCGASVTDPSLASKWLVYDLNRGKWSDRPLGAFNISAEKLPSIQNWGTEIGKIRSDLAQELGLPSNLAICVGAYDSTCAAIGSGVSAIGTCGVTCGSWQVLVAPTDRIQITTELVNSRFPITPYPGKSPYAILAQSPNGTAVFDWLLQLSNESIDGFGNALVEGSPTPSPILAIPHFSGAISPWSEGRSSRGVLLGLTLATTMKDILQALVEGVTYDLVLTLEHLQKLRTELNVIRAAGGGSRSGWWMQLMADLTTLPVEVVTQKEPGTFGAAILAGIAVGRFSSIEEALQAVVKVDQRFEPQPERRDLHEERMLLYREAVNQLIPLNQRVI